MIGNGVLNTLEGVKTYNDRPTEHCIITDCGVFKISK